MSVVSGGFICGQPYGDEEFLYGQDVKDELNYESYVRELNNRIGEDKKYESKWNMEWKCN